MVNDITERVPAVALRKLGSCKDTTLVSGAVVESLTCTSVVDRQGNPLLPVCHDGRLAGSVSDEHMQRVVKGVDR